MKHLFLAFAFAAATLPAFAANPYVFTVNLYEVENDRVQVVLEVPKDLRTGTLDYVMPKVVPGTYADYYFGRYIDGFTAYATDGSELPAESIENGTWRIPDASKLARLVYYVNDTFDDKETDNFIFQPAGTNIEAGENYCLNTFGFFGYFEGHREREFQVNLTVGGEFYPAAAWDVTLSSASSSLSGPKNYQLSFPSYFLLSDTPVLVARPDTLSFYVGGTRVGIATYSEDGKVTSQDILPTIERLAGALQQFFGTLPAERYDFLFFFTDGRRGYTGGFGALEHLRSSFYYLPSAVKANQAYFEKILRDVCAHEFMHILTPLNLHAEQIAYFDFRNPQMSEHLWLYEGCTEYFSHLVQLQAGIHTPKTFLSEMQGKMAEAAKFGAYSFTENSANILAPNEQEKYLNVYQKGALIGWMVDLKLRQLSGGEMTVRDLLLKLKAVYGPERPFKDDELFGKMAEYSGFPELETFMQTYVAGDTPLPYAELLGSMGLIYSPTGGELEETTFCKASIGYNQGTNQLVVQSVAEGNWPLDLRQGDVLLKMQGEAISVDNIRVLSDKYYLNPKPGQTIEMVVLRDGQEVTLTAEAKTLTVKLEKHAITPNPAATAAQQAAWQTYTTGKR